MSSSRQSIRPSLKDLSQSDDIDWPAAASSSRNVPPPSLVKKSAAAPSASSSSSSAAKKTVRIAQPTDEDIRYYQPAPKERPAPPAGAHGGTNQTSRFMQRRFLSKPLDDGEEEDEDGMPAGRFEVDLDAEEEDTPPAQSRPPVRPVMGGVQERPKKSRGPPQMTAPDNISGPSQGSSRFKAVREAERRAAASSNSSGTTRQHVPPKIQSSSTAPRPPPPQSQPADEASSSFGLAATSSLPRSSELADVQRPSADPDVTAPSASVINGIEEEWLDEDGQVMSAFRKARLKKQGMQPPGGIRRKKATAAAMAAAAAATSRSAEQSGQLDDAENAGQGAAPSASASTGGGSDIASLMRSISSENEQKVKGMKTEDVEQDLRDLEAMFGKDMLEQLRSRKAGAGVGDGAAKEKQEQAAPEQAESSGSTPPIRKQPSMSTRPSAPRLMFDAQGKAVASTAVPGRVEAHDHIDATEDGYSTTSVLLLARSTIAAQRTVALGIISSISARYGVQLASKTAQSKASALRNGQIPSAKEVATELHKSGFHLDAALTATIALSDRQRSVRHAALSCLRVSLLFGALKPSNNGSKQDTTQEDSEPARSIAQQLLDAGLLSGLGNILAGDRSERISSRELMTEILIQLVEHDDCPADALVQEKQGVFLESVLAATLKLAWPAGAANAAWPAPRAIALLRAVVASSRLNAQTLVQRESIDCVLRYIAIPPWQLGEAGDNDRARALGFDLFTSSLNLFIDLARYGMYASLVSRCWDLFEPVQPWAFTCLRSAASSPLMELRDACLLQSYYDLLAMWTVCATDPHQTTPEHEVTWSQLEGWGEWSVEVIKSLSIEAKDVEQRLMVFAAAGRHCKAWLDGAAINAPSLRSKVAGELEATIGELCGKASFPAKLQGLLDVPAAMEAQASTATEDDDEEGEQRLTASQRLILGCQVANVVLALSPQQAKHVVTEASTELLSDLEGALSLVTSAIDRHTILSLAVDVALDDATSQPLFAILSLLRPGEEAFAARMISSLQTRAAAAATSSSASSYTSLTPFYLECLSIRPNRTLESSRPLFHPPLTPTPSTLKRTMTLRPTGPVSGHLSRVLATSEESDNTDPTTQSLLWTCPASRGLKKEGGGLRPDWFLLPLDDLLRSAEAAVFNRKDNLPEEGWDPNERQVVKETLELSLWILDQRRQNEGGLASSHLWFAAQKVFMLESGLQGDLSKWTGAVTGKDLFRDGEIEPLLARLMSWAARLAAREAQQGEEKRRRRLPTLEDLAAQHLGSTDPSAPPTTYYAFYTDLVALYDAISYGHRLFAAALLAPLAMRQYPAPDYRRLVWRDHEHLLATGLGKVRIADVVGEEGQEGLRAYLEGGAEDKEEEDDMLRAYVASLLTPNRLDVTQADEALLPRIALHRVARFLWPAKAVDGDDERAQQRQKRRAALGRTVATQASPDLREALLRYEWRREGGSEADSELQQSGEQTASTSTDQFPPAAVSAEELQRRKDWLLSLAPSPST